MDARNSSHICNQLYQDTAWQWMWKKPKSMNCSDSKNTNNYILDS